MILVQNSLQSRIFVIGNIYTYDAIYNIHAKRTLTHPGWKCSATGETFISVTDHKEAFTHSLWLHQPLWSAKTQGVQQELHTDQRTHHVHRIPHDQPKR